MESNPDIITLRQFEAINFDMTIIFVITLIPMSFKEKI